MGSVQPNNDRKIDGIVLLYLSGEHKFLDALRLLQQEGLTYGQANALLAEAVEEDS